MIDSEAFEAFKRRAAEPQAEVELVGCALTRLGQDEREQPRVLLAAFRVSAILSKRSDRSTATLAYRCGRAWARAALAAPIRSSTSPEKVARINLRYGTRCRTGVACRQPPHLLLKTRTAMVRLGSLCPRVGH